MAWIDRLAGSIQHAPNGCHIWTKALNSRGYGVSWFDGKHRQCRACDLIRSGGGPIDLV